MKKLQLASLTLAALLLAGCGASAASTAESTSEAVSTEETAPAAVFHLLGGEMRKATAEAPLSPLWQDIYGFFDENSHWQKHLSLLKQGIGKTAKPERLSPKTAKTLYGKIFFRAFPVWNDSQAAPSPSSQNMV